MPPLVLQFAPAGRPVQGTQLPLELPLQPERYCPTGQVGHAHVLHDVHVHVPALQLPAKKLHAKVPQPHVVGPGQSLLLQQLPPPQL